MFSSILTETVLAVTAFATPLSNTHSVHEKRSEIPAGWIRKGVLDRRAVLPMRIALAQGNIERGYDWLREVSHPRSEKYGQHWSAKETAEAFAPRCVSQRVKSSMAAECAPVTRRWML